MSDAELTAEERGDVGSKRRLLGRGVVVVLIGALVGAIVVGTFLTRAGRAPWQEDARPTTTPTATYSPSPASSASTAGAAAELVRSEDQRLVELTRFAADDPATRAGLDTVVLGPRRSPYGAGDLMDRGALAKIDSSTYELRRHVVVRGGAHLALRLPGATLRLRSGSDGFASIVTWGGSLTLRGRQDAGMIISSWDDLTSSPDADVDDGRAYIRVRDGVLSAEDVTFAALGFWSGRTGGVAITGTEPGAVKVRLTRTVHTDSHYGVYAEGVIESTLTNVAISNSAMEGIVLSNRSHGVAISGGSIVDARASGVKIDRASGDITIERVAVRGSGGYGVMIDGSALADGANAAGHATTRSTSYTLRSLTLNGNEDGGVLARGADGVHLLGSDVAEDSIAMRVVGPASDIAVDRSTLHSDASLGFVVTDVPTGVTVTDSEIEGLGTAVRSVSSTVEISGSELAIQSGHIVEVLEDSEASLRANTMSGSGQDPVFTDDTSHATNVSSDQSAWRFQSDIVTWLHHHPMVWLWLLVLLVPLIGFPFFLRYKRHQRELQRMLENAMIAYAQDRIDEYDTRGMVTPAEAVRRAAAHEVSAGAGDDRAPSVPDRRQPESRLPGVADARHAASVDIPTVRPPALPTSNQGRLRAPRTLNDLRAGTLAGRDFATMRQFAVAAVLESGYPLPHIARLFRIPIWRLQQWVTEDYGGAEGPSSPAGQGRPAPRR
ncbi:hypothetical protein BKA24_000857 [Microbacterium marinum]|uniref:Right handed beta helix region n=1 Tax=Microbacterium marinum TaxID=421115 RepID=A0A7W7BNX5_9MICO|nr:right-handed parallel beta-helix repeat-containing protein [Microbacterium marinum]MBB4666148.1 hypothetical protein [Microbacterium marinum]